MMATEDTGMNLGHVVALLGAAVVAVPIFKRLGLGSVLGYLAAGLVIGPFGLRLFTDPEAILHVAEIGVVLFLFIIGLEMRPTKLWALKRYIFGLGAAQVLACGAALTGVAMLAGLSAPVAFIGAMGFVMSSTAVIMQMLDERGETATPHGQRAVSILLLEDLAVVPLLGIVAILGASYGTAEVDGRPIWLAILISAASITALVGAGRWLLNPVFRVMAKVGAREVMTAAALLVVLGSGLFMEWGGLSMAMGAFVAGVLLSESTFRHELEADIEPFRGLLLGLFFISVGMSLDLTVVAAEWRTVALGLAAFMVVKALCIYIIARIARADHREALERAALFAQGGEFAFVLYGAALAVGLFDARVGALMTALVILSMALTPIVTIAARRLMPPAKVSLEGIDTPDGLEARVLIIGFGRFAQVVSQPLLARGVDVSIIETDVDMIKAAGNFGFRVYYGDGERLDVLRASGAQRAEAILICVDKAETADKIVEIAKAEFPLAKLYVRAYDRGHALRLVTEGVDFQIRETFESALVFGGEVLSGLGFTDDEKAETLEDVRTRDVERFELQMAGGLRAGLSLMRGNIRTTQPAPLVVPRREGQALNEEAAEVIEEKTDTV